MPPMQSDSEDEVPKRGRKQVQEEDTPAGSADENEEEEEEEEAAEDEYIVEKIKAHKFEKGKLMLLVKWKGYDDPADETWEPEANCSGAQEVVSEYFESIGGRPKAGQAAGSKRKNASGTPAGAEQKKKRGRSGAVEEPSVSPARTKKEKETKKEEAWKPSSLVDWEKEVESIDTIEKNSTGLVCYIHWKNGHKSQHPITTAYQKCPQKMLKFYEQHLVFKENGLDMSAYQTIDQLD
ncbi:hypothetical protein BJ508DRAFT_412849 [Ascobolus immersus RN42]|uniref:Chromo domain-containing protein n=1 Tax=Ascobolus immersus RN42 TaxID=1160509 RepID=A0A3N4IIZ8_ASCIM|nr:hypothetical protein BJ508DRAFT_412849 [Ascobolus immersus RN42]